MSVTCKMVSACLLTRMYTRTYRSQCSAPGYMAAGTLDVPSSTFRSMAVLVSSVFGASRLCFYEVL